MHLLTELVALAIKVFYLALDFLNGTVDGDTLVSEGLKLVELLIKFLFNGVARLLSINHVIALLDHLCLDIFDVSFKDFYFFIDLRHLHVVSDVVRLGKDLFWLVRHNSLLGDVDLGEAIAATPFSEHELTVLAIELRLGGLERLVLLGERFQVLFLLLGLFLFSLLFQFLTLFRGESRVFGSFLNGVNFFLILLLWSLVCPSFLLGIFGLLLGSSLRSIDLFLSGC